MNFLICSPNPNTALSALLLEKMLNRAGHNILWTNSTPLSDEALLADAVYYRGSHTASNLQHEQALAAAETAEAQGLFMINSVSSILLGRHKISTWEKFLEADIPTPFTIPSTNLDAIPGNFTEWIIKPDTGSRGEGISVHSNWEEVEQAAKSLHEDSVIQPYLEGQTIRIVASDNKALYGNRKIIGSGNQIDNFALGSLRQKLSRKELDFYQDIAVAAVNSVGGKLMGVDLFETSQEVLALELNTGFAIHEEDSVENHLLVSEIEILAKNKTA